ncbi:MAG: LysE family translocator [Rhodospirillaceae bacterium]|nr:LysE family translocator [Rhodospirillaceae bacterium]
MSMLSQFISGDVLRLNPWLLGLLSFAFVSSITPGPNNILLAASGARFGVKRTLWHALGIWAGMITLLLLAALGFGALNATAPSLALALQVLAAVALIVTAWSMLRADTRSASSEHTLEAKPWSFWQGLGFQYLNPKALMMAVTAAAMTPQTDMPWLTTASVLIIAFMIVSVPCTGAWMLAGSALRRTLNSPRRKRAFNIVMALLLVATIPLSFGSSALTS